jgi:hypothetical protein
LDCAATKWGKQEERGEGQSGGMNEPSRRSNWIRFAGLLESSSLTGDGTVVGKKGWQLSHNNFLKRFI